MSSRWILKPKPSTDKVEKLKESLGISDSLAIMLRQRNIGNFDEAKNYFRPKLSQLHDPYLMKDMDEAVQRVLSAMENVKKIKAKLN